MGGNGCGWVCMGAVGCRRTNTQQNKVSRSKNDQTGDVFFLYGRGNFPERHVFKDQSQRCENACKCILLGLDGRSRMRGHGGTGE